MTPGVEVLLAFVLVLVVVLVIILRGRGWEAGVHFWFRRSRKDDDDG